MEQDRKPRDKFMGVFSMGTLSLRKEARMHNGEKIVSSISGAGETAQLHVKEWN